MLNDVMTAQKCPSSSIAGAGDAADGAGPSTAATAGPASTSPKRLANTTWRLSDVNAAALSFLTPALR